MDNLTDQSLARDHLSNERTFLAWVRTGIAIMAFGFLVVKSSMFIGEMPSSGIEEAVIPGEMFTAVTGIILVITGSLISVASYFRYRETKKQLRKGVYYHSSVMLTAITAGVVIVTVVLIAYLIKTM